LAGTFKSAATWKFDGCPPIYLLQREDDGRVRAACVCCR
jgi:hypothetical protein